jgi:hypothetical protein
MTISKDEKKQAYESEASWHVQRLGKNSVLKH